MVDTPVRETARHTHMNSICSDAMYSWFRYLQIHSMIQKLAQFTDIDAALIVGGLSLQAQAAALRAGPAIVVATPGRIIDHVRNSQGFGLEDLSILVLDEADRLLEMGFKEEVILVCCIFKKNL